MLKDAAMRAKPTKYAQNNRHGIYGGTPFLMNAAADRCSAPKTANGMAKHRFPNATTLSRPLALDKSLLVAHKPINRSTIPAAVIETAVRENSKKRARMNGCTFINTLALGLYKGNSQEVVIWKLR